MTNTPEHSQMLREYSEFVTRKAAPPRELSTQDFNLNHCALGLATEILELTLSNTRGNTEEEIQDLCWYGMLTANTLRLLPGNLPVRKKFDLHSSHLPLRDLQIATEDLVSQIKKHVVYAKPRLEIINLSFITFWDALLVYIDACGYSLELAIIANRTKLDERYKDGFTSEESELRKDKK
jgi:NTP pyrophosphatase (non-canonical NTP hydrolase)